MGLYDAYPYTNIHELNLRWRLKQLKLTQEQLELIKAYFDEIEPDIEDFKAKYPELADIADLFTISGNNASIAGTMTAAGFNGDLNGNAKTATSIAGAQNDLRKLTYNNYHLFVKPVTVNSWLDQVTIYESNDKVNYSYYIDEESLKNSGGSTIYVDNSYTGTSDGTQSKPYKKIKDAMQNASNNDTIKVAKGIYRKNDLPIPGQIPMDFNMNIICDEGTILTNSDALTWAQDGTYTNIYSATRSNVNSVIDVRNYEKGKFARLTRVYSVADCAATLGSWCLMSNTTLYVNIGEQVTNDKVVATLNVGFICFDLSASSQDQLFYLENAICIGSKYPIFKAASTSSYDMTFNAKNCKFLFGVDNSYDGLSLLGTKSVLINCEASFNAKDGFNYHAQGSKMCYGIEINCVGNSNGLDSASPYTYNGSTAHDGCQVIRINGVYINNKGANVADVQRNTLSLNFQCMAFDSKSGTHTSYDTDFCVQQAGATMYLYNCYARGNSWKNLYNVDGGFMYQSNCSYDSSQGTITTI